jgi:SAM-dependent MidA family methyltransferase
LPERFDGLVLANEVLDAMPAHLVVWNREALPKGEWASPTDNSPGAIVRPAAACSNGHDPWRPNARSIRAYLSEVSLLVPSWIKQWAAILGSGALLLIDYGFPRREYYHPQRDAGTLMCHYRHHAHGEPFYLPGLQDITLHVDFTRVVEAGCEAGLDLLGYTTQASFLFNCGLTEILARTPASDPLHYLPLANAAQKLVSPAEMGELFKVIALGKGINEPLLGFASGNRSATL